MQDTPGSEPPSLASIPRREHALREDTLTYLVSRYERASAQLRDRQFDAFRDFVGLWLETLDWRTEDGIRHYLQIPEPQRLDRFERFKRQAESWDVTLEFPVQPDARENEERERWKKNHERQRKKLQRDAADEAHWQQVKEMLEAEHRMRAMPSWLRDSFDVLGLAPKANLADARKRYRELAKKYHPDRSGDTVHMAKLNDAWAKVEEFFVRG